MGVLGAIAIALVALIVERVAVRPMVGKATFVIAIITIGIDIKTKAYLHQLLRDLSDQGTAILLITSDMPEMITLADRIAVMHDFRITGEIPNSRDYDAMSAGIMDLIHGAEAA